MRIRVPAFLALIGAALLPSPAFAYWDYGHQTVAKIAWANICPQTRTAIRKLLARQALLDTPQCQAGTIEQASIWPDCIKKLGPDYRTMSNWHFQDTALCKPYDADSPCRDGNCISAQIERDVRTLRDKAAPAAERVKALAFLIHLVGDLHQPLHAEDRDDEGGNKIPAAWGIYSSKHFSYHQVWDGPLAERAATTGPSLIRHYSAAERARLGAGNVSSWARQSWDVAHVAYAAITTDGTPCGPLPPKAEVDEGTAEKLIPAARLQIERGGVRLAKLLDRALG
jgi:hypothetical protein